jgi:23S rRNA pseudouridine1911/1915/1917 synthase
MSTARAVLGFRHPVTGTTLRFDSPLPADMHAVLDALRPELR